MKYNQMLIIIAAIVVCGKEGSAEPKPYEAHVKDILQLSLTCASYGVADKTMNAEEWSLANRDRDEITSLWAIDINEIGGYGALILKHNDIYDHSASAAEHCRMLYRDMMLVTLDRLLQCITLTIDSVERSAPRLMSPRAITLAIEVQRKLQSFQEVTQDLRNSLAEL